MWDTLTNSEARMFADFAWRETRSGGPLPAFLSLLEEARTWVGFASKPECWAYLRALVDAPDSAGKAKLARRLGAQK